MRVYRNVLDTLILFLIFLLFGCAPKMTVKEATPTRYKLYEDIELVASKNFGTWIKTDISIPKGAIVAVMANGEVWDIRNPKRWRWQPFRSLRFKIGEDGREMPIGTGIDRKDNLNVVLSGEGGFLHLGMGTGWRKMRNPKYKMGKITIKVIVWEKDRQDGVGDDLIGLIRAHPKDQQFLTLVAFVASCLGNMSEYQKIQNLYKMMKENSDLDWDRVYPTVLNNLSDFDRQLGRNESAKAHLEESLKGARRYGNRYMETMALRRLAMAASNLKQYEEANKLLEQALEIAMTIKNPEAIGKSLLNMGNNLLKMNRPAEAIEHLEKALEQFRRRDRDLMQRGCYLLLGQAYMRLDKNTEAKKSFESAIEVAVKASDPQPQWSAHAWLGRIAEREGTTRMPLSITQRPSRSSNR